jgi:hypothetical protein
MRASPRSRSDALREIRLGACVAAAALVVYTCTLYPDVPGGDAGELIGAVATGGVIHPPGYPLYAILGRAFLALPAGSIAWRLNLLSAVCDALAAGTLFVAVARWTESRWGGLAAAASFAFAPVVWTYATVAEVFALNNLFVATLLLLAVIYATTRDRRAAFAGAFAAGLALSNHHTILFVVAPLGAWLLWAGRRELLRPRPLGAMAALFVAGLSPYLVLASGGRAGAVVSWGETGSWTGFWTHVLRRDYGALRVAGGAGGAQPAATMAAWGSDLFRELAWYGAPLALAGLVLSIRRERERALSLAVAAIPVVAVAVFGAFWGLTTADALHREILARFWQEPDIVCFVWCGWAVAALENAAPRLIAPIASGALALVPLVLNWRVLDHHASRVVRDYGAEILRVAPPNAVLLTKGDLITNTTRYLQLAEGVRPDVRVIDQELLGYTWYARRIAEANPDLRLPGPRYMPGAPRGFFMRQLLDANFGRWPILVCGGVKEGDLTADATYGRWPFGLCELVHRGDEPVNVEGWVADSDAALPRIAFGDSPRPPGSWESVAWSDYWQVRTNRGIQLLNVAGADPSRRPYLATAAAIFQGVVDANPSSGPDVYRDLVLAIGRQGLETKEERERQIVALKRYLAVAPPDDPGVAGFQHELARLTAL